MAENIGQIPEEVDALAAEFELRAGDLENIKMEISSTLGGTTWTGSDRDQFQADWEGRFSQNIIQIVTNLRTSGQLASQNAQEQRDASAS